MTKFLFSFRFFIVLLTWLHIITLPGISFSSMNFAMVCLVDRDAVFNETDFSRNFKDSESRCGEIESNESIDSVLISTNHHPSNNRFVWGKTIQSNILSAYSWSAVCSVFLHGIIADKFGVKVVAVGAAATALISSCLTPIMITNLDYPGAIAIRLLMGVAGATGWPILGRVTTDWVKPNEKGIAMGIVSTGFSLGGFICNTLSGFLCPAFGWQSVFYMAAAFSLLHLILLLIFFSPTPLTSRWISEEELEDLTGQKQKKPSAFEGANRIPYKSILTSVPVLIVLITAFSERWVQFFIHLSLPLYLAEAFGTPVTQNGFLSAVPYLAQMIGRFCGGLFSEHLKIFGENTTLNTKFYNTLAFSFMIGCFLGTTFLVCGQENLVTVLMTIQYLFGGLCIAGYVKTSLELAPKFAGVILGLTTMGTYMAAVSVPYVVGLLTPHGTIAEWKVTLYVTVVIVGSGLTLFLFFSTAKRQPWAQDTKPTAQSHNKSDTLVMEMAAHKNTKIDQV